MWFRLILPLGATSHGTSQAESKSILSSRAIFYESSGSGKLDVHPGSHSGSSAGSFGTLLVPLRSRAIISSTTIGGSSDFFGTGMTSGEASLSPSGSVIFVSDGS